MRGSVVVVAFHAATVAVVCAETIQFTDQTTAAGVYAVQIPGGYPFGLRMHGGGAVADFDRDGHQDIFAVIGGTSRDKLFMNNGDGTFTDHGPSAGFTIVQYLTGVAVGDYNADGWIDIFASNMGDVPGGWRPGAHRLYRNNGDGTFTDVAASAGVNRTCTFVGDGAGAAFGDFDLDGDLDLATAAWISGSGGNRLFRNNGDGTFTDVTLAAIDISLTTMRGYSPRFCDMDGDRFPELLWASDTRTSRYLRNNTNGTFSDWTGPSGTSLETNGMGNTTGDYNGDGLIDWYVSSIFKDNDDYHVGNKLYLNLGNHVYEEVGVAAGVDDGGWGWGTISIDLNHDGILDIVETNGDQEQFLNEPSKMFLANGDGTYTDIALTCGFVFTDWGRGLVNFDSDNDGDQDIIVFASLSSLRLFRNDLSGPDTNWLRLFLDTSAHADIAPDGIGARVTILAGGRQQTRYIDAGCNYLSVSELSAHFGLADATAADITVEWANGRINRFRNVPANQTLTLRACLLDGDADGDGTVSFADLNLVLDGWGMGVSPWRSGDANGDGVVDFTDLERVLDTWGSACPL